MCDFVIATSRKPHDGCIHDRNAGPSLTHQLLSVVGSVLDLNDYGIDVAYLAEPLRVVRG